MCGIRDCLTLVLICAGVLVLHPDPSAAQERLLHCATSPLSAAPGQHLQHFAQGRFYAPVRSAMFFSRSGSVCRWKAPLRRHG